MTFHSSFVGGLLFGLPARSMAQIKTAHPSGIPITTPINKAIMQFMAYNLPVQMMKLIPMYGGLFSCACPPPTLVCSWAGRLCV